jgi:hypothetical protein
LIDCLFVCLFVCCFSFFLSFLFFFFQRHIQFLLTLRIINAPHRALSKIRPIQPPHRLLKKPRRLDQSCTVCWIGPDFRMARPTSTPNYRTCSTSRPWLYTTTVLLVRFFLFKKYSDYQKKFEIPTFVFFFFLFFFEYEWSFFAQWLGHDSKVDRFKQYKLWSIGDDWRANVSAWLQPITSSDTILTNSPRTSPTIVQPQLKMKVWVARSLLFPLVTG